MYRWHSRSCVSSSDLSPSERLQSSKAIPTQPRIRLATVSFRICSWFGTEVNVIRYSVPNGQTGIDPERQPMDFTIRDSCCSLREMLNKSAIAMIPTQSNAIPANFANCLIVLDQIHDLVHTIGRTSAITGPPRTAFHWKTALSAAPCSSLCYPILFAFAKEVSRE